MQTRRASKRLSSTAASNEGDTESSAMAIDPTDPPETSSSTALAISLPEDIDVAAIQTLVPDFNIFKPTSESIIVLYRVLTQQASTLDEVLQDRDATRAEVQRLEVELDQAIQDQDVQSSQLRNDLEGVRSELVEVRRQKEQSGL